MSLKHIQPMITTTHPTWRAVRLENRESVEYLNRLFEDGWHLMHIGADDLHYLAFEVPVSTPSWTKVRSVHHMVDVQKEPVMRILVLHSGPKPGRQKAMVMERDERGRIDMAQLPAHGFGWRQLFVGLLLESGDQIAIVEQVVP